MRLKLYGHRCQSVSVDINGCERYLLGSVLALYGGLGSTHSLCCVGFRRGFVNGFDCSVVW